ncbi:MAG: DUF2029 domain-containing protein [Thermoleophilia bacterium]|nr:DUF2029 domain-containing protein [Thermoleophilia bacterium]
MHQRVHHRLRFLHLASRPQRRARWIIGLAVLLCAAAANVFRALRYDYFLDLSIYRWGGIRAFDAGSLYALIEPLSSLQFTYTPFAALLFAPLSHAGLLEALPWTIASLLALARMSWLVGRAAIEERQAADAPTPTRRRIARAALLVFGLMLLLEPATETLRLGQVNFFLGWLIAEDVLGRQRPWRGVGIGIATAIKLTPATFLVLLAVTHRLRAAAIGVAAFVLAGVIGFVALPQESRAFWSGAGFDAGRTGAVEYISNQSINGMLWRLLGPGGSTAWWLGLSALCAAVGIWAARRAWRRGARNLALGVTGLVGCLVSPVSWTHHWVLVLPLLIGLWSVPRRRWLARLAVVVSFVLLGSRLLWRLPSNNGLEFHASGLDAVAGNSYVLLGFVLLAIAASVEGRGSSAPKSP